jgi:alkylation response protein AidB-like acyl-CoA dehydrogenase
MDLHLTSEQSLLRDSAAKFIDAAGPKVARSFRGQEPGFSPERLREAGELGWLGILVPEQRGGLGLGLTELALVLEQCGRGLVCEPVALAALSAGALARGSSVHPMLERVVTGSALVVPALQERAHGDDPLNPRAQITGQGGTSRITGQKAFVCADGAEGFLVSAHGTNGAELCYVARNAPGCTLAPTQTVDGRRLWTLSLADAPADRIAPSSSVHPVEALHNLALFALAAELLGVMEKAQEVTLDYLRIRKQFGKLIGSFQALQHQTVNMYIRVEATRSLVYQIAANTDATTIDAAMAMAAKAKASEDAIAVTETCIQHHGGIGFTDEHDIGLYLKRAMLLSSQFGNAAAQRRRYIAAAGLTA